MWTWLDAVVVIWVTGPPAGEEASPTRAPEPSTAQLRGTAAFLALRQATARIKGAADGCEQANGADRVVERGAN